MNDDPDAFYFCSAHIYFYANLEINTVKYKDEAMGNYLSFLLFQTLSSPA